MSNQDMMRAYSEAAAGVKPDDSYSPAMLAAYHRTIAELIEIRKTNPSAHYFAPSDVGGLPDADPEKRADWDPDQPRDEKGRFGARGGGDFKVKEGLGTVGKAREAAYVAPNWSASTSKYNTAARAAEAKNKEFGAKAAENMKGAGYKEKEQVAKALAGRDAGAEEYRKQLAEQPKGPVSGMQPWEVSARGQQMQLNEERLSAQGHESHEAPNPLGGQQIMPEQGDKTYQGGVAKELDDRIHEALKNNAKLGDAGIEPARVIAEVHERIANEKEALGRRQAADREAQAKATAIKKERDDKISAADDKVQKAADARREAAKEWVQANAALADARERKANDTEINKLKNDQEKTYDAREAAQALQDAAQKERDDLEPQAPERMSSERNLSDLAGTTVVNTESLGGGANASSVAILSDNTKAVYKPVSGERSGLRKNVAASTYYLREAAASAVAEQLGVSDLVPATVVHDGPNGVGSLQAFVPDADTLYDRGYGVFDRDASERMRTFDWITGNSDRHPGNVMMVEKSERKLPILIDNGLAFPKGQPERMITPYDNIPHEPMSDKTIALINGIDHVRLASALASNGIEKEAVRYAIARSAMLKSEPQMLSAESRHTASYDWDEVPEATRESLETADKVLSEPSVRDAFIKGGSARRGAVPGVE